MGLADHRQGTRRNRLNASRPALTNAHHGTSISDASREIHQVFYLSTPQIENPRANEQRLLDNVLPRRNSRLLDILRHPETSNRRLDMAHSLDCASWVSYYPDCAFLVPA